MRDILDILRLCKSMPSFTVPLSARVVIASAMSGLIGRVLGELVETDDEVHLHRVKSISLGLVLGALGSSIFLTKSKTEAAILFMSSAATGIACFAASVFYCNRSSSTFIDLDELKDKVFKTIEDKPYILLCGAVGAVAGAASMASLMSR